MSKKLFVILGALLLVALGYSVSLAAHPRTHMMNAHPDQEPLLRPDVKLGDPCGQSNCIRPLPGGQQGNSLGDNLLLRPDIKNITKQEGHPWGE